jgi:hypothetical protein
MKFIKEIRFFAAKLAATLAHAAAVTTSPRSCHKGATVGR